ncbi:hypothetical protein OG871_39065 [Kitasatospora sp. NBC_00374]|uniref:hypothetical protein n=1 Tax=Kitasatospora sp. NBC_00374 TaxID=2975964 RepID=UPI0030E4CB69
MEAARALPGAAEFTGVDLVGPLATPPDLAALPALRLATAALAGIAVKDWRPIDC